MLPKTDRHPQEIANDAAKLRGAMRRELEILADVDRAIDSGKLDVAEDMLRSVRGFLQRAIDAK